MTCNDLVQWRHLPLVPWIMWFGRTFRERVQVLFLILSSLMTPLSKFCLPARMMDRSNSEALLSIFNQPNLRMALVSTTFTRASITIIEMAKLAIRTRESQSLKATGDESVSF